jgi:hypothetical protein
LVLVFDPLALVLIMAALSSYRWEFDDKKLEPKPVEEPKYEKDDGPLTDDQIEQIKESVPKPIEEPTAADMELTADSVVATNLKKKEEQSPKRSDQTEQESQQSEQSLNQENENSETDQNQSQNLSQSIKKLNFNLKEKFNWKKLTDWNQSPTLNLVKKLLPPKK